MLAFQVPIAFAMGIVGFLGLSYINSLNAGFSMLATIPYTTSSDYILSCVPLFILMGLFCFHSGISQQLFSCAYKILGELPGGLAMATIAACGGFSAISGSSMATAATMGTVALPEMKRYNYKASFATGTVAAGGTLGILIPPSLGFILYAILTEQSIGRLFISGIIPGILLTFLFIVMIYFRVLRNPELGPRGPKVSFVGKVVSLKNVWGMLLLFLVVMGGIYAGIFTATEAAGVGAFGGFLFAVGKRTLTRKNFFASLRETVELGGMLLIIMVGAMMFNRFLAITTLPVQFASLVAGLPVNSYVILAAILFVYVLLGCVMEITSALVLTLPIFFPVVMMLGFDPIWFGVLMVLMQELGLITPPVGLNIFVIAGINKETPMSEIFKGVTPYVIVMIIFVIILIAFPQISLFLPGLMD
jgi:tripartite ATP-independent transporter DctM subunit